MAVVDDGVTRAREPWVRRRQPPSGVLLHRAVRAGLVGGVCVYSAELEYTIQVARASKDVDGSGSEAVGMVVLALAVIAGATLLLGVLPTRIRAGFSTVILAVPATIGVLWGTNLLTGVSIASSRFLGSALLDALAAAAVFAGAACLTQLVLGRDEPEPPAGDGFVAPTRRAGGSVRWSAVTALVVLLAAVAMTYRWVATESEAPAPGPPVFVAAGCTRPQLTRVGGTIPADFHPVHVILCALKRPPGVNADSSSLVLTQRTGTGDLAAVVAAIRARARGHQHWNGYCASTIGASDLVFVDASGRALLAALPYDNTGCLKAPHDLPDALVRLAWSPTIAVA